MCASGVGPGKKEGKRFFKEISLPNYFARARVARARRGEGARCERAKGKGRDLRKAQPATRNCSPICLVGYSFSWLGKSRKVHKEEINKSSFPSSPFTVSASGVPRPPWEDRVRLGSTASASGGGPGKKEGKRSFKEISLPNYPTTQLPNYQTTKLFLREGIYSGFDLLKLEPLLFVSFNWY